MSPLRDLTGADLAIQPQIRIQAKVRAKNSSEKALLEIIVPIRRRVVVHFVAQPGFGAQGEKCRTAQRNGFERRGLISRTQPSPILSPAADEQSLSSFGPPPSGFQWVRIGRSRKVRG